MIDYFNDGKGDGIGSGIYSLTDFVTKDIICFVSPDGEEDYMLYGHIRRSVKSEGSEHYYGGYSDGNLFRLDGCPIDIREGYGDGSADGSGYGWAIA